MNMHTANEQIARDLSVNIPGTLSLKRTLYKMSGFISVLIGILIFTGMMFVQLSLLKTFSTELLGLDILATLIVVTVIFLICLLHILLNFRNNKPQKRRFLLVYLLSVLLCLAGAFVLKLFASDRIYEQIFTDNTQHQTPLIISILVFLGGLLAVNLIIMLALFHIAERNAREELEYENVLLKMKNIETSYLQLRQQVNPHFLFNVLSSLKILIKKQPDKAEVYVSKLSGFLRKTIQTSIEPVTTVEKELAFCDDYVELQKMRFGEALFFSVEIPENVKKGLLPVFSVQQLLENAIKHNSLTMETPLNIRVKYENQHIIVTNNLQAKQTAEESTGTGLANLSERYRLLSSDEIVIESNKDYFSVSIKVLNDENCNYRR